MLDPLDDGHVELEAEVGGKIRYFNPEPKPRFWQEFSPKQIKQLFKTTEKTLVAHGFGPREKTRGLDASLFQVTAFGYVASSSWKGSGSGH